MSDKRAVSRKQRISLWLDPSKGMGRLSIMAGDNTAGIDIIPIVSLLELMDSLGELARKTEISEAQQGRLLEILAIAQEFITDGGADND